MPHARLIVSLALSLGLAADLGAQAAVRSIEFRGNTAIDDDQLRAAISTRQAPFLYRFSLTRWIGLAEAPAFDASELRRDVLRIQALYGVRGFPDATVDTTLRRDDDDLDITFRITEGEPIVVDTVHVAGLTPGVGLETGDILTVLPLQAGAPFDRLAFQTSASVLEALLRDRGHAFAKVTGGFQASDEDPPRSVSVTLTAEPGPRAKIREVLVEGTDAIDDRVVLKTLMIEEGQVFSDSALHEGMTNLQRTEMFRQVRVSLVDSVPSSPADSLVTVAVRAELAEYPLRRARVSAGYGTLDCFRAMGSVDLFNFQGDGRRLEFRARTSQLGVGDPSDWGLEHSTCRQLLAEDTSRLKLNYNLAVTLHDPLLSWENVTGMATVYFERHTEFGAYLREAVGGEVALTRQIATDVPLRGAVAFAYGRTIASPATFCALLDVCVVEDQSLFAERRKRTVLDFELVRDRTNSVNDPSRGSALVTELRWSPAFLGSDELMRFVRLTAGYKEHHPLGLSGGRVFSWRLRAGALFAPRADLPSGRREFVPPEERLFAGGSSSVRGFGQNQLGPVVHVLGPDSTIRTSATGGTFMAVGNVELRVPMRVFGLLLFGAVFVDGGIVSERDRVALDQVRVTPGLGVRMPSVLGPIRLDIGYNPHPPPAGPLFGLAGDSLTLVDPEFRPSWTFIDRLQLHLSIGQAF